MTTLLTTIPFSGFYHSFHSEIIDDEQKQIFSDDWGEVLEEYEDTYHDFFNYRAIELAYSQKYVEGFKKCFLEEFEIDLEGLAFESLVSPREYNFSTDTIYCHIPLKLVEKLGKAIFKTKKEAFSEYLKNRFTSHDGFISFYLNDIEEWQEKPFSEWDHNETGSLIEFLWATLCDDDHTTDFNPCGYDQYFSLEDVRYIVDQNLTDKGVEELNKLYELREADS